MNLVHWIRKEDSGMSRAAIELAKYEERAGHTVVVKNPSDDVVLYGEDRPADAHMIHASFGTTALHDHAPTFMWMHGEPLSSVGNGHSMKAIVSMAPLCDAFFAMRREEVAIWQAIKRTYFVPKGIDLERYRVLDPAPEALPGEPAVLYVENWRRSRNPLYLCVAMEQVWKKFPKARLHLYNVRDQKMLDIFNALIKHTKWDHTFLRSLKGPVGDVTALYNKAHIVVSCLYPLYARGIEAFGAGRAFIGPGYQEPGYPYTCELHPDSMAAAITKCWENYDGMNYRKWAEERHDVAETVRQTLDIVKRYTP